MRCIPCPAQHGAHVCCALLGRHDLIDCEYKTFDETVLELRRNKMRVPMDTSIEFKVLAQFSNNLDDEGTRDTHYTDVGTLLSTPGVGKADLKRKLKEFYKASYDAAVSAIDAWEPTALDDEGL